MHKPRRRKLHMLCANMEDRRNKQLLKERHRQKLALLISEMAEEIGNHHGAQAALARSVGSEPSHFSAIMSGTRGIGLDLQGRLEAERGKPPGWFNVADSLVMISSSDTQEIDYAGRPKVTRGVPVVGTARMGDDGFYEEISSAPGAGDGFVEGYSSDPNAYALRVRGDSMFPTIRDGQFVVVEPNGRCVPGECVSICLVDGRRMVKELLLERSDSITVVSVNGGARLTLERAQIEHMHPVSAVIAASKWQPE